MEESISLLDAFEKEFSLLDEQKQQLRHFFFVECLPLLDAFENIAITDENRILRVLSKHLGIPLLEREDYPEKPELLEGVSMFFLRKHAIFAIEFHTVES